jgi:hypothetical protein
MRRSRNRRRRSRRSNTTFANHRFQWIQVIRPHPRDRSTESVFWWDCETHRNSRPCGAPKGAVGQAAFHTALSLSPSTQNSYHSRTAATADRFEATKAPVLKKNVNASKSTTRHWSARRQPSSTMSHIAEGKAMLEAEERGGDSIHVITFRQLQSPEAGARVKNGLGRRSFGRRESCGIWRAGGAAQTCSAESSPVVLGRRCAPHWAATRSDTSHLVVHLTRQSNQWSATHFNKGNQKHKSPTKPRLLTSQIQRQRSQRGVVPQSANQRLRSFCADYIAYRHTRVERSKYEFSNTVPMGDAVGKVIATIATSALDTWQY